MTPIGWTFARKLFALLFDGTVPFVQSLFVKAGGSIQGRVILFLFRASSNHVSKRAGSYPIPASKISKEAREVMKSLPPEGQAASHLPVFSFPKSKPSIISRMAASLGVSLLSGVLFAFAP